MSIAIAIVGECSGSGVGATLCRNLAECGFAEQV
jgi:hypothetical protein